MKTKLKTAVDSEFAYEDVEMLASDDKVYFNLSDLLAYQMAMYSSLDNRHKAGCNPSSSVATAIMHTLNTNDAARKSFIEQMSTLFNSDDYEETSIDSKYVFQELRKACIEAREDMLKILLEDLLKENKQLRFELSDAREFISELDKQWPDAYKKYKPALPARALSYECFTEKAAELVKQARRGNEN